MRNLLVTPLRGLALAVLALGLMVAGLTMASPAHADPPDVEPEQRDRPGLKYDAYALPSLANLEEYHTWKVNGEFEYETEVELSTNRAREVLVELVNRETGKVVATWTLTYTNGPEVPDVRNTYRPGTGACDSAYDEVDAWVDITNNNARPTGNLNVEPVRIEDTYVAGTISTGSINGGQTTRVFLETSIGDLGLPLGHYILRILDDDYRLIDRVPMTVDYPGRACGYMPRPYLTATMRPLGRGQVKLRLDAHRSFDPVRFAVTISKAGERRTLKVPVRARKIATKTLRAAPRSRVVVRARGDLLLDQRTRPAN